MIRTPFLSGPTLALALALGSVAGAGLIAAPALAKDKESKEKAAEAPKLAPSKAFVPVYNSVIQAIQTASKRPDVIAAKANVTAAENTYKAATTKATRAQALTGYDAALAALAGLVTTEHGQVDEAFTKATTADDKYLAGQLALNLGNVSLDKSMQRRGLQAMLDSGKLPPADVAKYNYYVGGLAFDSKDYAGSAAALGAAIAAGYTDPSAKTLLAEAQYNSNQPAAALATLKGIVAETKAAGQPVPAEWLDRGVQIAYTAKLGNEAVDWAIMRLEAQPSDFNWISAAQILREKANYGSAESIDLSRLLDRAGALKSNSQSAQREYIEYVQAAVGKAGVLYPGEVAKVAAKGIAVGALQRSDPFVSDALSSANARMAADKASLPGLERDARAANATAKTALIAADTFLSYDQPAKAAELYALALTKPGIDAGAAQLRLGIALYDQGKYDEAKAAFAKVTGPREPLARMWTLLASKPAA